MAEDLRRFLADEPIRPARSAAERYWRWARRHPVIAVLGGVLAAVLMIATIASLLAAQRFQGQAEAQSRIAEDREAARRAAVLAGQKEARRSQGRGAGQHALLDVQSVLRATLYANRTNRALAAFEANDLASFRTLLEECKPQGDEPDLRGWGVGLPQRPGT